MPSPPAGVTYVVRVLRSTSAFPSGPEEPSAELMGQRYFNQYTHWERLESAAPASCITKYYVSAFVGTNARTRRTSGEQHQAHSAPRPDLSGYPWPDLIEGRGRRPASIADNGMVRVDMRSGSGKWFSRTWRSTRPEGSPPTRRYPGRRARGSAIA